MQYVAVTYKQPVYSSSNKIIGVLGLSYYLNKIKNDYQKEKNIIINLLTDKEINCIKQMMLGKTAKETAVVLGISYKTVEFHIANIKMKLNCYRKSEIIEKFINQGITII